MYKMHREETILCTLLLYTEMSIYVWVTYSEIVWKSFPRSIPPLPRLTTEHEVVELDLVGCLSRKYIRLYRASYECPGLPTIHVHPSERDQPQAGDKRMGQYSHSLKKAERSRPDKDCKFLPFQSSIHLL